MNNAFQTRQNDQNIKPKTKEQMSNDLQTFSHAQIQQMIFIYNAVMAGWTTKRISNGNFKFKKRHRTPLERQFYMQDGFLSRFMQNMQRLEANEVSSFEMPYTN